MSPDSNTGAPSFLCLQYVLHGPTVIPKHPTFQGHPQAFLIATQLLGWTCVFKEVVPMVSSKQTQNMSHSQSNAHPNIIHEHTQILLTQIKGIGGILHACSKLYFQCHGWE